MKKKISAKELQAQKIEAEIKINEILEEFQKICIANDFDVHGIKLKSEGTDADRWFDVDILLQ